MKLRLICLAVAGHALSGCTSGSSFDVVEPVEGQVFDRTLVRVRMTPPAHTNGAHNSMDQVDPDAGHAEWRVNHGYEVEPLATHDTDADHGYNFAVTLEPGASLLEVGRCDVADRCDWESLDVRVDLKPGSPDPAFAGTGILAYPQAVRFDGFSGASGIWPRVDGRVLVAAGRMRLGESTEFQLIMFGADGTPDSTWGMYGAAAMPGPVTALAPRPDGGYSVIFNGLYIGHVSAAGVLDTSVGTAGARPLDAPSSAGGIQPYAFAADSDGGFWIAGVTPPTNPTKQFILHVDGNGDEVSYQELGDGTARRAAVSSTGEAAFVTLDHVVFSSGASVALPTPLGFAQLSSIALAPNGDALVGVQATGETQPARVYRITTTNVAANLEVPFYDYNSAPLFANAPDGSTYIAGPWNEPPDGECCKYFPDAGPSIDVGVLRLSGSALDTSFGTAHASAALAWAPMTTERTSNTPDAIAVDANGNPWVVGGATTTEPDAGLYTVRGPSLLIATFMK